MPTDQRELLLWIHPLRHRARYQIEKVRVHRRCQILHFGVYAWSMVVMMQLAPVR